MNKGVKLEYKKRILKCFHTKVCDCKRNPFYLLTTEFFDFWLFQKPEIKRQVIVLVLLSYVRVIRKGNLKDVLTQIKTLTLRHPKQQRIKRWHIFTGAIIFYFWFLHFILFFDSQKLYSVTYLFLGKLLVVLV